MASSATLVTLDGSHGEGGGALLRAALSMSALTQQGFQVQHIRSGTKFSGLDVEDITLIRALQQICDADVTGLEPGSQSLLFLPKRSVKAFNGTIETERNLNGRGSNSLIIAGTLIPLLARSGSYSEFTTTGETASNNSMSYDYFAGVVATAWRRMNLVVQCDLERAAYSREGRGECAFEVEPSSFAGISWADRGAPKLLRAVVSNSNLNITYSDRAVSHLQKLAQSCRMKIDIDTVDIESDSPGIQATVWMQYERGIGGGSELGGKTARPEQIAQTAFEKCFDWMAGEEALDPIVAEHLLLPACFADQSSEFKVSCLTARFMTMVWVIKQFSPVRIVIRGNQGGYGHVTISR
jgi:RNA 3'-terminal phosphate cyclase (ATP)